MSDAHATTPNIYEVMSPCDSVGMRVLIGGSSGACMVGVSAYAVLPAASARTSIPMTHSMMEMKLSAFFPLPSYKYTGVPHAMQDAEFKAVLAAVGMIFCAD